MKLVFSILFACLLALSSAAVPTKDEICKGLASVQTCLASPNLQCLQTDVCNVLDNLPPPIASELGKVACVILKNAIASGKLDKIQQAAAQVALIVTQVQTIIGCSKSVAVLASDPPQCDGIEKAICMFQAGDIPTAVKDACAIIMQFDPKAEKVCNALPTDLDKVSKVLLFILQTIAAKEACNPIKCAGPSALSAAAVVKPNNNGLCQGCYQAVCLLQSGDIDDAEKAICDAVGQFVPSAASVCKKIFLGTKTAEEMADEVTMLVEKFSNCGTPPPCAGQTSEIKAAMKMKLRAAKIQAFMTKIKVDEESMKLKMRQAKIQAFMSKINAEEAGPKDGGLSEGTCETLSSVFCLFKSGDFNTSIAAVCDAVEILDKSIQAVVKKICKDVEVGTVDAEKAVDNILDAVMFIGNCGKPNCAHLAVIQAEMKAAYSKSSVKAPALTRFERKGARVKIVESSAQICKGAEAGVCCAMCEQFIGMAERVVLGSDTKELAEKKMKEMCAAVYAREPMKKLICDGMVEESLDQAWEYIQSQMDPKIACVKMHACPESMLKW